MHMFCQNTCDLACLVVEKDDKLFFFKILLYQFHYNILLGCFRLDIHMHVHTGEYPYKCHITECFKNFNTKFKLDRHLLTHGSRDFTCTHCGKVRCSTSTLYELRSCFFFQLQYICTHYS